MNISNVSTDSDNIRKLGELLKGIHNAMLTTVNSNGSLYSRPMGTQELKFDGDLWFFTSRSSGKIVDIENDQQINLAYADPKNNRYVSVTGKAKLIDDRVKAQELWTPMVKIFFPDGVDDPELILLKVDVESAEYWTSPSSGIIRLVGFAKALVNEDYAKLGDHARLQFH